MKPTHLFPLLAALLLAGCAGNNNSDANNAILFGPTGTVTNINGIDIYQDIKPTRPYKVLSTVQDVRQDNLTPNDTILHALAQQARAAGGNAIIVTGMKNKTTGGQNLDPGTYTTTPPSNVTDRTRTVTTAQVILYSDHQGTHVERISQPMDVPPPPATSTPLNSPL